MTHAIYAYGNKCSTLHIIPEMKFSPSLCGFTPTANRGGTPNWSVVDKEEALSRRSRRFYTCEKCEKIFDAAAKKQ